MNKKNIAWLKEKDYVDNMKPFSRICYHVNILRHIKQTFGSGYYTGIFCFNKKNPLTWLFMLMVYFVFLIASIYDAFINSFKETKSFIEDDIEIELNKDYGFPDKSEYPSKKTDKK